MWVKIKLESFENSVKRIRHLISEIGGTYFTRDLVLHVFKENALFLRNKVDLNCV